ncbi:MAG: hypothetical protein HYV07_10320 [Deltaproteobacteria bacterium]|nr:hypothetical protein [Deltaproteobacteria bacterium]
MSRGLLSVVSTTALLTSPALHARERSPSFAGEGPRAAILLHVVASETVPPTATKLILSAAREAFESSTDLEPYAADELGISPDALGRCLEESTMSCWLKAVRATEEPSRVADYVLVVSLSLPSRGAASNVAMVALLVDLLGTETFVRRSETSDRDAEAEILGEATVSYSGEDELDSGGLVRLLSAVRLEAERLLKSGGHLRPNGRLTIRAAPGSEVSVDGRRLGTTGTEPFVRSLSVGPHKVDVIDPSGRMDDEHRELWMELGAHVEVRPKPSWAAANAPAVRALTRYAGLGAAAAGVAISAYALLATREEAHFRACTPGSACEPTPATFASFGELSAGPGDEPTHQGLVVFPLGTGLVVSGALWTLGTELYGDEYELPWIPLLVGLGGGLLCYGVLAAAAE